MKINIPERVYNVSLAAVVTESWMHYEQLKSYDCCGSLIEKWLFIFYYVISRQLSSLCGSVILMTAWASLDYEWLACETVAKSYCLLQEGEGRELFFLI